MRMQLRQLDIIGGNRSVSFEPGLNLISGTITSGKTALLKLCRFLLTPTTTVAGYPKEVRETVTALHGDVEIGSSIYRIVRPFVSTRDAIVQVAGPDTAERLPITRSQVPGQKTYRDWLLGQFGLPELRVPLTRSGVEGDDSPVTFSDYFIYCYLPEDEIDKSILYHRDYFRDNKRRAVFDILYGRFDANVSLLQERLRELNSMLRLLRGQADMATQLLAGTPWENRAALEMRLAETEESIAQIEERIRAIAEADDAPNRSQRLRNQLLELDRELAELIEQRSREEQAIVDLQDLQEQLGAQVERLTRSIIAGRWLLDFEFRVCPRCGTALVPEERGDEIHCGLCLQEIQSTSISMDALAAEQDRLGGQIRESEDLIRMHQESLSRVDLAISETEFARRQIAQELDFILSSYLSDRASRIAETAAERQRLKSLRDELNSYMLLYANFDRLAARTAQLESEREDLEAEMQRRLDEDSEVEARITRLEANFEQILREFEVPDFGESAHVSIDRTTLLPIINGTRFDDLGSKGLKVLINVAHIFAHHITSMELSLGLPQIILIDGLTSNIGREGSDLERVSAVYRWLIRFHERWGDDFQVIVSDLDIPAYAREFVRIWLTDEDRLIRV